MKPDTPKFALVLQSALDWLFGSGPDADGFHFHETMDIYRKSNIGPLPAYWWRSHLRELISAALKPDCVGVEELKRQVATYVIFHQETGPEDDVGDIDTIICMCVDYLASQGLLSVKESAHD